MNRASTFMACLIAILTLVVFGGLCFHEFTFWDDNYNVWQNPRLNPPTLEKIAWYWRHSANGLYIPLTYTVWGALAAAGYLQQPGEFGARLNPYVFHSANVLLHVIAALVVWGILRRLVRNDWAACIGALVFALHPVQVEPVGWVAGLKDVMCGAFSFIALLLYLQAVECRPHAGRKPAAAFWALYAAATASLVLAMLSKPSAMVVPAIALVLHVWGLGGRLRQAGLMLLPWLALSLACAIVAKVAQPAHGVPAAPLWARPLLAGDALAFYLGKLIFPARLGIDYGWRPTVIIDRWWFYVLWVVPVIMLAWLVRHHRRRPMLFAAGALFVIGLSPVLGLVTFLFQFFSTVADHYLYIAMLGPALAVAWLVAQRMTRTVILASCVVLAAMGGRSILQTRVWQDDFTLFTNALRVNPNSFVAWHNLGYALKRAGQLDEAEHHFRQAISLKPNYWEARQELADVLFMTGRADEGIEQVKASIEIKKALPPELGLDPVEDHVKLGDTLASLARYAEAAEQYRMALKQRPGHDAAARKLRQVQEKITPP